MEKQLEFLMPETIDVNGYVDEARNIRYIGLARQQLDGKWRCLAAVGGMLCLVEVTITRKK